MITHEQIRAAGGIVHGDGNIFFTNLAQLNVAIKPALEKAEFDGFSAGTVAACGVLYAQDNPTAWSEVVHAAGPIDIVVHAMLGDPDGDWEWGGFAAYAERELGEEVMDAARQKAEELRSVA